jgi:hypothetical protein
MKSYSLFYGRPASINAFPTYSDADLIRDAASSKIDAETKARIETEFARRAAARKTKRRA